MSPDLRKATFDAQTKIFQEGQKYVSPILVKIFLNTLTVV